MNPDTQEAIRQINLQVVLVFSSLYSCFMCAFFTYSFRVLVYSLLIIHRLFRKLRTITKPLKANALPSDIKRYGKCTQCIAILGPWLTSACAETVQLTEDVNLA
jgi:hypothetical protein